MKIVLCSAATLAVLGAYSITAMTAPVDVKTQIEQGKKLFTDKCSKCHGAGGEGIKDAPPVVGKEAFPLDARKGQKRDAKFHTAADVFAWASKHMPMKGPGMTTAPGSLSTDEYLAIFAFDLTANGIKLDKPLDGAAAAKIVLHP